MIKKESGFKDGDKVISSEVIYTLTAAELEQREREAFEAGQDSVYLDGYGNFDFHQIADDYLKQRREIDQKFSNSNKVKE